MSEIGLNTMKDYTVKVTKGEVFVRQWGDKQPLFIALPGFSYAGTYYEEWAETLQNHFTFCALDLPFHGQTKWTKKSFNQNDILEILEAVRTTVGAPSYHLLGHSFGGRIITALMPKLQFAESITLLAPAGIGRYTLIYPLFIQRMIEWSLRRTGWYKAVVNVSYKLGLISRFQKRYAEVQIYPTDERNRLFRTWNTVLHFDAEKKVVRDAFMQTKTPVKVVLGLKDKIIPPEKVFTFFDDAPTVKFFKVSNGKHDLVLPEVAEWLCKELNKG